MRSYESALSQRRRRRPVRVLSGDAEQAFLPVVPLRISLAPSDPLKGQRSLWDWLVVLMLLVIMKEGMREKTQWADGVVGTQGRTWSPPCDDITPVLGRSFHLIKLLGPCQNTGNTDFFVCVFQTMTHSFGKCHHPPNSKEEDFPQCHHSLETVRRNEEKPKGFVTLTYN